MVVVIQFVQSSVKSIINAGTIDNEVEYILLTENPVANNYLLSDEYEYGTLKINKRPITVSLCNIVGEFYYGDTVSYNGEYANNPDLVDGEMLEVAVAFKDADGNTVTPKNVGTYYYEFNLSGSTVTGSIGGAGIDNYDITCTDKKSVEIKALAVTVKLDAWASENYNGETYEYTGSVTIVEGGKDGKFAYDETFELAVYYYSVKDGALTLMSDFPRNAGNYAVKYDALNSRIGGYQPDVNYSLTVKYPNVEDEEADYISFTINPKNITIFMDTETVTYDGTVYDYATENYFFDADEPAAGETIIPVVKYSAEDGTEVQSPKYAGKYTVELVSFTVTGANTLAENYKITNEPADLNCELNIAQREIVITVKTGDEDDSIELNEALPAAKFTSESIDGDFGFTEEDLKNLVAVYEYYNEKDDSLVPAEEVNQDIGKYVIKLIRFIDDEDVLKNYDIKDTETATLEVTPTKVDIKVNFNYTGKQLVYDGNQVKDEWFSYEHFHKGYEPDPGFVASYNPDYKFVFTKDGVDSYDLPKDAGTYEVTIEFENLDLTRYKICDITTATFTIDPCPVNVAINGYSKSKLEDYLTYNYSELPKGEDFLTVSTTDIFDGSSSLDWYYDNEEYGEVSYNYAGIYHIRARIIDSDGNYEIANVDDVTFTVDPAVIYITPNSKSADYVSATQQLALEGNEYKIRYGKLYGDESVQDVLTITEVSGDLRAPTPTRTVTIREVGIMQGDRDVRSCYDVHYTYVAGDTLVGNEPWYTKANFTAILSFKHRTVNYTQIVLDDPERFISEREFLYTGRPISLGVDKNTEGLITLEDSNALLPNARLELMVIPMSAVDVYTEWVVVRAVDRNTGKTIPLYDFVLTNAEQSKIVIKGIELKMTIDITNDELKEAWNNNDTSVLKPSTQYGHNGYYVLSSSYYWVDEDCLTSTKHTCEVLVRKEKDGKLAGEDEDGELVIKVIVFEESASGSRAERSIQYELKVSTALTATVKLTTIGEVKATIPTTTPTQANSDTIGGYSL